MNEQSPYAKLALATISAYVRDGRVIGVPADVPDEMRSTRAGVFVCLKRDGDLRGCIGTIDPIQDSLAEEIITNAVSAATKDPRFLPVEAEELGGLECTVDVLCPAEPCEMCDLDPARYGVIVESGPRRGLLLPDLDGVETAEEQVDIARRKAFINYGDPIKLYRFEVIRHK